MAVEIYWRRPFFIIVFITFFNATHSMRPFIHTLEMYANICAISMYLLLTIFLPLPIKEKEENSTGYNNSQLI